MKLQCIRKHFTSHSIARTSRNEPPFKSELSASATLRSQPGEEFAADYTPVHEVVECGKIYNDIDFPDFSRSSSVLLYNMHVNGGASPIVDIKEVKF